MAEALDCAPDDLVGARSVSGGCIHAARLLELADGRRVFMKSGGGAAVFAAEAEGLRALAAPGEIRVPAVLALGESPAFLVLEWIESGPRPPDLSRDFGRALARLHRTASADRFGWDHDNWLGSTPQPNSWEDDWCEFWRRNRLGHQLELAHRNGFDQAELHRLGGRLLETLEEWLAEPQEPPSLLHGDLWSGNYLVDTEGSPVLLDPATYFGRREAELGMTTLFGGFDRDFYAGYEAVSYTHLTLPTS